MEVKCEKCIVSFTVLEGLIVPCPNCGQEMKKDNSVAHDGKIDVMPTLLKRVVLRPLN